MCASPVNPVYTDLINRATDAFGTAEVFRARARKYRRRVGLLTFFGLAIPGAIGAVVLANLLKANQLESWIYVAGVLGVLQFLVSIWSVVANWPDQLDYASTSSANNFHLSDQLKALAPQALAPPANFEIENVKLIAQDDCQNAMDNQRDISDSEKVYAHRAGLMQFQRQCHLCHETPTSMKMPLWPGNRCPVCGGPKLRSEASNPNSGGSK